MTFKLTYMRAKIAPSPFTLLKTVLLPSAFDQSLLFLACSDHGGKHKTFEFGRSIDAYLGRLDCRIFSQVMIDGRTQYAARVPVVLYKDVPVRLNPHGQSPSYLVPVVNVDVIINDNNPFSHEDGSKNSVDDLASIPQIILTIHRDYHYVSGNTHLGRVHLLDARRPGLQQFVPCARGKSYLP
jgi:hypothetical protein